MVKNGEEWRVAIACPAGQAMAPVVGRVKKMDSCLRRNDRKMQGIRVNYYD